MEISLQPFGRCDLIVIKGRVDSNTSPNLSDILIELTTANRCCIILDLEEVSYMSSAGLRVLIDVQKRCKRANLGEVVLIHVPQRVYDTLELAGFVPLFKFYDNAESAIDAF